MTTDERMVLEAIRTSLHEMFYGTPYEVTITHQITSRIWALTHKKQGEEPTQIKLKIFDADIPTCCGGIALTEDGKCPICGDKL